MQGCFGFQSTNVNDLGNNNGNTAIFFQQQAESWFFGQSPTTTHCTKIYVNTAHIGLPLLRTILKQ